MKQKLDLELICIYNDNNILESFLIKSLEKQTCTCKLTLYDGSNGGGQCAAAIYNELICKSTAKVIICCHHDISFETENILEEIYEYLNIHSRCIVGAAGVIASEKKGREHIVYGNLREGINKEYSRLIHLTKPKKVLCLDECFFGFNREIFRTVQFDANTCNGWHFYAADLCYTASEYGIESYVYPLDIWHRSTGKIENDFYVQLRRVQKKYRKRKRFITPCIDCKTRIPAWYYKLKRNIWLIRSRQ